MDATIKHKAEEAFIQTRISLLERLRNREDQESWREFYETYGRLIYCFAKRCGLSDQDAQEALQDTVVSVVDTMPKFEYDPAKCSFKTWLLLLTKRRIVDQIRKRPRERLVNDLLPNANPDENALEIFLAPDAPQLEAIWQAEWEENIRVAALERLRRQTSAEHFQIYVLRVVQGKSTNEVSALLGVKPKTIDVIKHRLDDKLREIGKNMEAHPI